MTARGSLSIVLMCLLSTEAFTQSGPEKSDMLRAASGVGVAVGVELLLKDHLIPSEPRFTTPNPIDAMIRKRLYWGKQYQELASTWSDALIYGVSLTSLVWGPLASTDRELSALINMEVFAVNSIVTNIAKIAAARERPYHHYSTRPTRGRIDFASFFSGHSSVAFSQAVSNAMILSDAYPNQKDLIWTALLVSAGTTAYLRVAGDMHYFSDIIVGAGMGSLIAWSITRYELDLYKKRRNSSPNIMIVLKFPLG